MSDLYPAMLRRLTADARTLVRMCLPSAKLDGEVVAVVAPPNLEVSAERLGRLVREVWLQWARGLTDPKPSWLLPWEKLDVGQREVDMQIGTTLYEQGYWAGVMARSTAGAVPGIEVRP